MKRCNPKRKGNPHIITLICLVSLGRRRGGVGEWGKAAIRERRQSNINRKHQVIQDHMKKSGLITLGIVTFGVTINA